MQIYSTASPEISIVHEAWSLVDANITSYPLATIIRRINIAYEELIGIIINADGTWEYDDTNWTDHPRGTGTLVEGQQDYSFASEYLQIEAIDVKDTNGLFVRLTPIDHKDFRDKTLEEIYGVDSSGNPNKGMPEVFDQNGDTIRLYPAPTSGNVKLSGGLRVWFKRTADLFTISDTTQSPGLPSTHHSILAYKAALPYAAMYKPKIVAFLQKTIGSNDPQSPFYGGMTKSLVEHYANRELARPAQLTVSRRAYK